MKGSGKTSSRVEGDAAVPTRETGVSESTPSTTRPSGMTTGKRDSGLLWTWIRKKDWIDWLRSPTSTRVRIAPPTRAGRSVPSSPSRQEARSAGAFGPG